MPHNPLIKPILDILDTSPLGLSEYELICRLTEQDRIIKHDAIKNPLGLFKTHFLVMNALYRLQQRLMSERRFLSISALDIQLSSAGKPVDRTSIAPNCDEKLRDYYLDWTNLTETTTEDVNAMLEGFWSRYLAMDERTQCLEILGLPEGADWQQIQQQYRRLARRNHPDKGGSSVRFIEIREAFETLRRIFHPSNRPDGRA